MGRRTLSVGSCVNPCLPVNSDRYRQKPRNRAVATATRVWNMDDRHTYTVIVPLHAGLPENSP